jgi:hypothetical protein
LVWNSIPTKRAGSSSEDLPNKTGNEKEKVSLRRSNFLGFTHIGGKDRNGNFTVKRRTIPKCIRAKLREIKQQPYQRMHDPVAQTGEWRKSVVQG